MIFIRDYTTNRKAKPMAASVSTTFQQLPVMPAKPPIPVFPFFWQHPQSGVIRRRTYPYGTPHPHVDAEVKQDLVVHIPGNRRISVNLFSHDSGCTSDGEAWANRVRDGSVTIAIHQD